MPVGGHISFSSASSDNRKFRDTCYTCTIYPESPMNVAHPAMLLGESRYRRLAFCSSVKEPAPLRQPSSRTSPPEIAVGQRHKSGKHTVRHDLDARLPRSKWAH